MITAPPYPSPVSDASPAWREPTAKFAASQTPSFAGHMRHAVEREARPSPKPAKPALQASPTPEDSGLRAPTDSAGGLTTATGRSESRAEDTSRAEEPTGETKTDRQQPEENADLAPPCWSGQPVEPVALAPLVPDGELPLVPEDSELRFTENPPSPPRTTAATEASLTPIDNAAEDSSKTLLAGSPAPPGDRQTMPPNGTPELKPTGAAGGSEQAVPSSANPTASDSGNNDRAPSPEPQNPESQAPMVDGMADAPQDSPMMTAENSKKILGEALQKLPTGILGDLMSSDLVESSPSMFRRAEDDFPSASLEAAAPSVGSGFSPPQQFQVSAPTEGRAAATAFQPESTAELLVEHVATMKQLDASHMEIVLRPDAKTEIRLQLRLAGAETTVSAQLERGNQANLAPHWNQLQQALAHHGIRLGGLNEPERTPSQTTGDFHSPTGQGPGDERARRFDWEPAFRLDKSREKRTPLAPLASLSAAPIRRGKWEFWA